MAEHDLVRPLDEGSALSAGRDPSGHEGRIREPSASVDSKAGDDVRGCFELLVS